MELEELLLEWSYRCKDGIVDLSKFEIKLRLSKKICKIIRDDSG
jgi:hypothetical protein